MNINKEVILKNISAILCVICVIALVLPFCKVTAEVSAMGVSAEESVDVKGISMITDSGLWGYAFIIAVVGILLLNYLKQIAQFKKLGSLVCSGLMVLSLFLAPGGLSAAAGGEDEAVGMEITVSYAAGFWIILVCAICLVAISLISFLGLKGNPLFDAINSVEENSAAPENTQNVDFSAATEKLGNVTKNITQQAGAFVNKTKESVANARANSAAQPTQPQAQAGQTPVQQVPVQQAQVTPAPVQQAPVQQTPVAPAPAPNTISERENNDYIMSKINQLFEMKEKGILTEEEFTAKKKEYLSKL